MLVLSEFIRVSRRISVLTYRLSISNAVRRGVMDDGVSDVFKADSNVNAPFKSETNYPLRQRKKLTIGVEVGF
jgi:hypothetical protein